MLALFMLVFLNKTLLEFVVQTSNARNAKHFGILNYVDTNSSVYIIKGLFSYVNREQ